VSLTPDEIIKMRRGGFLIREIADKAGPPWTGAKVGHFLRTAKVIPDFKVTWSANRPIKNDYPYWLLYEMYWVCSLSLYEIAYELDIPKSSLNIVMGRLKIPLRNTSEARQISMKRCPYSLPSLTREHQIEGGKTKAIKQRQLDVRNAKRRKRRAELKEAA
jgi:hypothetical protein